MFDRGTRGRFLRKAVLGHGGGVPPEVPTGRTHSASMAPPPPLWALDGPGPHASGSGVLCLYLPQAPCSPRWCSVSCHEAVQRLGCRGPSGGCRGGGGRSTLPLEREGAQHPPPHTRTHSFPAPGAAPTPSHVTTRALQEQAAALQAEEAKRQRKRNAERVAARGEEYHRKKEASKRRLLALQEEMAERERYGVWGGVCVCSGGEGEVWLVGRWVCVVVERERYGVWGGVGGGRDHRVGPEASPRGEALEAWAQGAISR